MDAPAGTATTDSEEMNGETFGETFGEAFGETVNGESGGSRGSRGSGGSGGSAGLGGPGCLGGLGTLGAFGDLGGLCDDGGALEPSDAGDQREDCAICSDKLRDPRLLSCLHVFCEMCIHKKMLNDAGDALKYDAAVVCPSCKQETKVGVGGAAGLPADCLAGDGEAAEGEPCGSCKSRERAVARCADCRQFLCASCTSAHEVMRCFERHRVAPLDALRARPTPLCVRHGQPLERYCRTCEAAVCTDCVARDHDSHRHERLDDAESALRAELRRRLDVCRARDSRRDDAPARLHGALDELQRRRDDARIAVADAFVAFRAALERCHERALRALDRLHKERELQVMDRLDALDKAARRSERARAYTERLLRCGDAAEVAVLARFVAAQLARLSDVPPDAEPRPSIEFVADVDAFECLVLERFCKFETESSESRTRADSSGGAAASSYEDFSLSPASPPGRESPSVQASSIMEYNLHQLVSIAEKEALPPPVSPVPPFMLSDLFAGDLSSPHAFNNLQALAKLGLNTAEVNGCGRAVGVAGGTAAGGGASGGGTGGGVAGAPAPFARAGKATPMHIRYKFGQLGSGKGQFNSPHGFCLGNDEDIVVADTNNHRITVFDKSGVYKFHFGAAGKEEGQLWYPRKVAVVRASGKFVVCDRGNERSRMQIFTKNGHFLKKIAVRYIDIVAGLAVTAAGHIVAVDSVTPTVFVISEGGDLLTWFDCSECMREPSDIAISQGEFYVCDFKGHCVVVFTEDGKFVRRIGCENVTNFPNGIDVSDAGDVLIGDSHGNKFHVAVFARDGALVSEFECPYVKVSRCCGLKITSEGYIVTLAKNNHHVLVLNTLYIN